MYIQGRRNIQTTPFCHRRAGSGCYAEEKIVSFILELNSFLNAAEIVEEPKYFANTTVFWINFPAGIKVVCVSYLFVQAALVS